MFDDTVCTTKLRCTICINRQKSSNNVDEPQRSASRFILFSFLCVVFEFFILNATIIMNDSLFVVRVFHFLFSFYLLFVLFFSLTSFIVSFGMRNILKWWFSFSMKQSIWICFIFLRWNEFQYKIIVWICCCCCCSCYFSLCLLFLSIKFIRRSISTTIEHTRDSRQMKTTRMHSFELRSIDDLLLLDFLIIATI